MHEEELEALARTDKEKAEAFMFNRLVWLKVHEIMQRLEPPARDDETVEAVLTRAKDAGDTEAEALMTDEGRAGVMQEAKAYVDKLAAGDEERTVESYISDD